MAAGDVTITYGTRTVLANISRLHSNADGVAEAFGEIDNTVGAQHFDIHMIVPINSSATAGTYDLYLVESQDGAEWTDGIDPNTSGDVAAKLADALPLRAVGTVYNASNRSQVQIHLSLDRIGRPAYFGFVLDNNSGQTIPASGADGDSVAHTTNVAAS